MLNCTVWGFVEDLMEGMDEDICNGYNRIDGGGGLWLRGGGDKDIMCREIVGGGGGWLREEREDGNERYLVKMRRVHGIKEDMRNDKNEKGGRMETEWGVKGYIGREGGL